MNSTDKNLYILNIQRFNGKKTSTDKILKQIEFITSKSINESKWFTLVEINKIAEPRKTKDGLWHYQYEISFTYNGKINKLEDNKSLLKNYIDKYCKSTVFSKYPWSIFDKTEKSQIEYDEEEDEEEIDLISEEIKQVSPKGEDVPSWDQISLDENLLHDDKLLSKHPAFKNIFGLNSQIRTILSSIKSAIDTRGDRRNHTVLWGKPACGKTQVVLAIEKLLGPNAILRLDATSTSRAGLEKLFFKDLAKVPPIVVCEEMEKAKEEWLQIWLGALDDRGEIRKVNFRTCLVREVRILFICTVNDKHVFDKMMGGEGSHKPGALSSRCVNDVYFPRPNKSILRSILKKDILEKGGRLEYIDHCIELAEKLEINDPRKVLSFLSGGDRLISGHYQRDLMEVNSLKKEED